MFAQEHSLTGSSLEQMLEQFPVPYSPMSIPAPIMDRSITSSTRWKPNIEVAPNCPRCASTNTKFCYYNNYSLSQPRYFCKGCRRYWTKGGSLRNVPVGGGCRKQRRGKAARHSQSESPSTMNNNTNGNSDDRESSAGDRVSETNGSRDIDMALVFAKFLNQKPSSDHEELFESEGCNNNNNNGSSCSNNMSTSLTTPESVEMENDAVVQPLQKGRESDAVIADSNADDILPLGLLGGVPVEGTMENFGGESDELNLSGIDELEGFDVVQDVVWCDNDDAITCYWQPPLPSPPLPMMQMQMQLQELEYSMAPLLNAEDDHQELLPISSSSNSMNLISDGWSTNWSPFDLSTMEVFLSRP